MKHWQEDIYGDEYDASAMQVSRVSFFKEVEEELRNPCGFDRKELRKLGSSTRADMVADSAGVSCME